MTFLRPELGWWLLGALACAIVLQWRLRRRYAASATVRWLHARVYQASVLRRLPLAIAFAAIVLIGFALMQPVLPFSQADVQSRGLDIVVVLDLSSSMQEEMEPASMRALVRNPALPVGKTRLEATKDAIRTFVRGRRDDRLGLVVFSDHAYVVSPLTFDHEYLVHYIDMVDDRILQGEGQTAIGEGVALANYLLSKQSKDGEHGHQVIVLFTDGENNLGRDPVEVLKESKAADIRVHFVGVALEEQIRDKPDVRMLLQTITQNGGRYFNATSAQDLVAASRTIDTVEKGFLVSKVYVRNTPVYHWFALPALLCLAVAAGVRAVPYFVDQT
jgi:Ca-activated chloride channel family protein